MKYSIIIPYRDRADHLCILLPALVTKFANEDYEVIISEQADEDSFRIAAVENIGYQHSNGKIIILQQVDYIPHDDVSYEVHDQPILPARRGIFVNADMTPRAIEDIPAGYRNWHNEITHDFYGGVIAMKRRHFEEIGGLNPLIKNWGSEDDDLRLRFHHAHIPVHRNEVGTFTCLYHKDSNPELYPEDSNGYADFLEGRRLLSQSYENRNIGYKNLTAETETFEFNLPNHRKGLWVKSKNYEVTI